MERLQKFDQEAEVERQFEKWFQETLKGPEGALNHELAAKNLSFCNRNGIVSSHDGMTDYLLNQLQEMNQVHESSKKVALAMKSRLAKQTVKDHECQARNKNIPPSASAGGSP